MEPRLLEDTTDVLYAIADRVRAIPGIAGASYPADNFIQESPWAMVRQSLKIPELRDKSRAGAQIITAPIEIVVLVVSSENSPRDAARIDPLVTPIHDAFDVSLTGGAPIRTLPGLRETSDNKLLQIWKQSRVERGTLKWGQHPHCYAGVIRLDVRYQRKPKG